MTYNVFIEMVNLTQPSTVPFFIVRHCHLVYGWWLYYPWHV